MRVIILVALLAVTQFGSYQCERTPPWEPHPGGGAAGSQLLPEYDTWTIRRVEHTDMRMGR
jgi:hypothetical protein